MIFKRGRRKRDEATEAAAEEADGTAVNAEAAEVAEVAGAGDPGDETDEAGHQDGDQDAELDLEALDALEWRDEGPWDISEVDDVEGSEDQPRIDLGSIIITGTPGTELRLQVAEETQQIVSAMLVMNLGLDHGDGRPPQVVSSALELGAYAAPRSGGLWAELREEIAAAATEAGGSASYAEGPFGVELRRLIPVTTPDGSEGYQPSRMWVAEGPRWLLRGIVYGQAAVEEGWETSPVAEVLEAFRAVVVRRGDEAMAPGDLLPLAMPEGLSPAAEA